MAYRTFVVPRHIYSGPGSLESLATVQGKRAFIVTDTIIRNLGILDRVTKILHTNNIETQVFDQVEAEPSKDTAWKAFSSVRDFKPDVIVGLGGGSSMDVGKVAWVLYEHPDLATLPFNDFAREFRNRELRKKAIFVAITTSSGTSFRVWTTSQKPGLSAEYTEIAGTIRLRRVDYRPVTGLSGKGCASDVRAVAAYAQVTAMGGPEEMESGTYRVG